MKSSWNKLQIALGLAGALLSTPASADSGSRGASRTMEGLPEHMPGELLVRFKPSASLHVRNRALGAHRVRRSERDPLEHEGRLRVRLERGRSVRAAMAALKADPEVEAVQPNYIYRASGACTSPSATGNCPNDTKFGQLWGLRNTGQQIISDLNYPDSPRTNNANSSNIGKDMDLPNAWLKITDCSSVIVAVLDTGVNYNHEDLSANMWNGGGTYPNHGYDFAANDNDPMDLNGHGTHVSATIGAVGDNSKGTTGVCWSVKIMALRVLDASGSGNTADIANAIQFAVDNGAHVINMSLGGGGFDSTFEAKLQAARSAGITVVVAAGNSSAEVDDQSASSYESSYPCSYTLDNIVCVGALDQNFGKASYSNFGRTSVDVAAPGTNVVSNWFGAPVTVAGTTPSVSWTVSTPNGGASAWAYGQRTFGSSGTFDMLLMPSNWSATADVSGGAACTKYLNGTDSRVYKTFDLTGRAGALLSWTSSLRLEADNDIFRVAASSASGDPFASGSNEVFVESASTSAGNFPSFSADVSRCVGATCTIGFKFTSNGSTVNCGATVDTISLKAIDTTNTAVYNVISGTSMATPHVAGLAALIKAWNPTYTYADVVGAIKGGGVANSEFSGITTTGRSVSATGSLSFINPPSGVTAVKQ